MTLFKRSLLLSLFGLLNSAPARAEGLFTIQSPVERVPMLELFSSEGCSSCPPAEKWLTGLRAQPGLWRDFVPMQFHVDYWDNLGWSDAYAKREFTDRQQHYAAELDTSSVYTPEFVLNGQEAKSPSVAALLNVSRAKVGVLQIRRQTDGTFAATFSPVNQISGELQLHGVLLGNDIETKVLSGENRGATLRHDFVALVAQQASLKRTAEYYRGSLSLDLPEFHGKFRSYSVAFWVSSSISLVPIQAVGADLKP